MHDPNLQDFYQRIARVEAARSMGLGFEAVGTLGRSHHRRVKQRKFSILKPLLLVGCSVFGLKSTIHYQIGADLYDARVAELRAKDGVDRIGGILMSADPATVWLANQMRRHL